MRGLVEKFLRSCGHVSSTHTHAIPSMQGRAAILLEKTVTKGTQLFTLQLVLITRCDDTAVQGVNTPCCRLCISVMFSDLVISNFVYQVMSSNCTVRPPISQVYFSELPLAEKIAVGICGALCLGVIALFIDKAYFLINHYQPSNPEIKIKSLWLVGIYPVFAVAALLAILVPRAALLCDLVSTVYLAVCLVHFNALIILYSDGAQQLLEKVAKTGFSLRTPPCCCCCFCCHPISASRSNLQRLWFMVLQTSFLQPFISFVTLVLWLDEKYVRGQVSFTEAYLYLSIVNAASTLVAMYGLLVLFRSVRAFLRTHSITQKFVVLQLVLLFHNLQGFIFVTLAKYNIPPCLGSLSSDVRSYAIQHMIVVGEMFLLAVMARVLYRRPHRISSDLESEDTCLYDEDGASGTENCSARQNQKSAHRNGYQELSSGENQEHSPP